MNIIFDRDKKGLSIILEDQDNLTKSFRLFECMEDGIETLNGNFEVDIDAFSGVEGKGAELKQLLE